MLENNQMQGVDDAHEEVALIPSLPDPPATTTHVSWLEEGNWDNLISLLEVLPDALILIDADGLVINVNSQTELLFGYTRAELEGKPLEILLPERFRSAHLHHRDEYAATPRTRPMGTGLSLFGLRKDGTEFAVDISLSPLLFNGSLHVLTAVHDLTSHQQLETSGRAVDKSTEARLALLQLILDELPTCMYFVTGSEARLVFANRAALTMWGALWPTGQPMQDFLVAHHIRLFDTNGHALSPTEYATVRALHGDQPVFQHQEIIRHSDGTGLPVLVNAVALDQRLLAELELSDEGSALNIPNTEPAALVVLQDVTSLKEAEQMKDQFIGLVAHELRNPLAVLKGFATMLLRYARGEKGTALASWQKEALTEIDEAANALNRLTEDLLDVVRLQAGRLVLHRESIDLVIVIKHAITQTKQSDHHHRLAFSSSLSRLQAYVDKGRVEQVLANLLTNAIKYSPDGGSIELTLQVLTMQQEALISIRDQGIGIPEAEQDQLFNRFVRASNSQNRGISGTGLGLYLCRELVGQHGGQIWFESTEGAGSTFFISLPLMTGIAAPDDSEDLLVGEGDPNPL